MGLTSFLSAMVAADRLFHFYCALWARHFASQRPEDSLPHTPLPPDAASCSEAEAAKFPTVVVQLPMFNEREVCRHIIDACCRLEWPKSRLLVQASALSTRNARFFFFNTFFARPSAQQRSDRPLSYPPSQVLDDSTDTETRARVAEAVQEWAEQGVRVEQRLRSTRQGYKAGAMMDAEPFIRDYDFVAIFDADFSPEPDFLLQTVPYLVDNPRVAMVQARWTFANAGETMLTRVQGAAGLFSSAFSPPRCLLACCATRDGLTAPFPPPPPAEVGLNYHVKCEQVAR